MVIAEILIKAVDWFSYLLYILIFVRIFLSWIPRLSSNIIGQTVHVLTEPILGPIRALINKSPLGGPGMMLDFSPLIATVLIMVARNLIISLIIYLATGVGL